MSETRIVLVVVAHPDDEALGCAGTLRRHADAGDSVCALSLTDGVGARGGDPAAQSRRAAAAQASAEALGFTWLPAANLPDNQLDTVPLLEIVQCIERAVEAVCPDLVYLHHPGDLNIDHQLAARAALTALRPQPGCTVRELRSFEVPSATEWSPADLSPVFHPDLFVEVEAVWPAVRKALSAYGEELRPAPHPRSIEAIEARAVLRGAQVGMLRSEAFRVLRRLVPAEGAP